MLPAAPKLVNNDNMSEIIQDITKEISLEALSLARDLDGMIHQCVPFKYQHISNILKKTLDTNVQASTLENVLAVTSSKNLNINHLKISTKQMLNHFVVLCVGESVRT